MAIVIVAVLMSFAFAVGVLVGWNRCREHAESSMSRLVDDVPAPVHTGWLNPPNRGDIDLRDKPPAPPPSSQSSVRY